MGGARDVAGTGLPLQIQSTPARGREIDLVSVACAIKRTKSASVRTRSRPLVSEQNQARRYIRAGKEMSSRTRSQK